MQLSSLFPIAFLVTKALADGAAIVAAMTTISDATVKLNNTVSSFPNNPLLDLLDVGPLLSDSVTLLNDINAATSIAQQSANLTLLEAIALLRKKGPIHLAIAGEGPMRRDLPREIERLDLNDCVTLLGHRTDVPNLLASLDVLVLPSYAHEGIPQIILQAQAMARPIVATRIGGIPEVVEDGRTGLLVERKDSPALAEAIGRLLNDPSFARGLGQNGRQQIETRYSLDAMGERLLELYVNAAPK